jgi:hypothetical protein
MSFRCPSEEERRKNALQLGDLVNRRKKEENKGFSN